MIAWDSGTWTLVEDACPGRVTSVFGASGALWTGWVEDSVLTWARVE